MPRRLQGPPTSVSQHFSLALPSRHVLEAIYAADGTGFGEVINAAMIEYFLTRYPALAKTAGIAAPAQRG